MIEYRFARITDALEIYKIDDDAFSKTKYKVSDFEKAMNDEFNGMKFVVIVAIINGKIVGYIMFQLMNIIEEAFIYKLAIASEYRRGGIATGLINTFQELYEGDCIRLNCRVSNYGALKLYKKLGFELINTIKDFYDDEDGHRFRKRLR